MSGSELFGYPASDGNAALQLHVEHGTIWLTQAEISARCETIPQNITPHTKAIFAAGERRMEATRKESLQVRREGGRCVPLLGNAEHALRRRTVT